jgi:hypothetical protein
MNSPRAAVIAAACACGFLATACRPTHPEPIEPRVDPCIIADGAPADITVAIGAAVSPGSAPAPANDAERLLFAQLYDTLVRVDCTGAVLPGIAAAWSDSGGIVWRFAIHRNLEFSDGAPIDAAAVMRSWQGSTSVANAFVDLTAISAHELRAELRVPVGAEFFGQSALAIGGARHDGWPAASGAWQVTADGPLTLAARDTMTRSLSFHRYSQDMRSALDGAADMIASADAALADYAAARGGYTVTRLPWTRTYVLATGARSDAAVLTDDVATSLSAAVRAAVRPAQQPFWWEARACGVPGVPFRSAREARDIVFLRGDQAAQSIAERIAAQAWPRATAPSWLRALLPADYGATGAPRAVPLDEPALLQALRARLPLAVVVALPRMPDPACTTGATTLATTVLASGWQPTPLLDARDALLHRTGAGRASVDAWGTIRFHEP